MTTFEKELTMNANDNIKTIQAVYEAFGRGDVGTILEHVTDDVDWGSEAASTSAPWYGIRHGKDAVTGFFTSLGSTMEVTKFEPVSFAANDTDVFTLVHYAATSRATGRTIAMNLLHCFRFRDGKIAYYRGTEDTEQTASALAG